MKLFTSIIIHYDEIGLKGKNQQFFIAKLIENLKAALGSKVDVKRGTSKIVVSSYAKASEDKLKLIPGISNFAPALFCKSEIKEISQKALEIVNFYQPKTFKIETVRAHKKFELNSQEISREVGSYVLQKSADLKVDVHNPELLVKIELEKEQTALLGKKQSGVGGLPVGSTGRVLALLSGGIDSPVAAFLAMKRGARVDFIHFHNQTINKKGVESKIKKLVKQLEQVQGEAKLYIVPFSDLQKQVIAKVPSELRMIIYRRLMFKIAERLAKKIKAKALVTGDNLGQVASQTMENMAVIYQATDMLKLAPLLGFNKKEIIKIAEQINTYDISIEPYEDCCSLMISKHPETRADLEIILKVEENLDLEELINDAVSSMTL